MRVVAAVAALFLVLGATGRSAPPRSSFGVVLDAKSGRAVATVRVNQPIRTAIADGRGGWFIGGGFIRAKGVLRKRLAHIGPDGRLDPLWKPEANGNGVAVTSLARVGSSLYVGGDFARLQHTPRLWVGAFDTHSGRLLPWQPPRGGINYPVLLAGRDRVYLGGYGVRGASGLAAVRPTDARPAQGWRAIVDTSNIEGGGVRTIAKLDRTLYIAGLFGKVNAVPTPGLAAVEARTGRLLRGWRPRRRPRYCSGCSDVTSLAAGRGVVFAGIPGAVLALDPRSGATRWRTRVGGFEVNGLALMGNRLYVVGDFGLRALDAATGRRIRTWSPPSTQTGVTAAPSGKRVLISLQPN